MQSSQHKPEGTLVDLRSVRINTALPQKERVEDFVRQIKDPYHFKVGEVTVSVAYAGGSSLNDRFVEMLSILE